MSVSASTSYSCWCAHNKSTLDINTWWFNCYHCCGCCYCYIIGNAVNTTTIKAPAAIFIIIINIIVIIIIITITIIIMSGPVV